MYDFVRYNLAISHQNDVAFNRKIHLKAFNGWKNNFSYDADFLFLGTFDEEISELFIVEEWEVCSWITRGGTYRHPFYPPYGFNLFEIKWP